MTSSGLVVTLSLGPLTMSLAPAAVRRSLSVETTLEQVDRYGLLRSQLAAKKERLTSDVARAQFHDRLAAFAQPVSFANVLLLAVTLHCAFRWRRRRFLEHAAFSMHIVSFVLLSSVALLIAIRFRFWLGGHLFLVMNLVALWQFAYVAVAIRRFYLGDGRWIGRLLSVAAAMLIYVLNAVFLTAVQVGGAAVALVLA